MALYLTLSVILLDERWVGDIVSFFRHSHTFARR